MKDEDFAKLCENVCKARAAIVEKIGSYKKGKTPGASGVMNCPVCGGKETLRRSSGGGY